LLHVPLVIRGPNGNWHSGERNNDLVELTDLFPTILSLAGQDPPEYVQGHDLVQWLDEDVEEPLRPALFSAVGEYHGHLKTTMPWGLPESGRHPSLVRAARTRKFAYIRDPDYGDEAYNVRTDPYELRNLFQLGDPLPPQVTVLSALLDEEIQSCERLKREIPVIPGKRNFDEPLPTTVIGSEDSKK
jgi:arylsulfatase A-like enzyme